jgi:Uma2 family endonuclease
MVQPKKTGLSIKEYIEVEHKDDLRYEYFEGKIFTMAGGSRPHNEISGNIF